MTADYDTLSLPAKIAERGEEIYATKFKEKVEECHAEGFVAIDVMATECHFGETAEDALQTARQASPNGVFHLIQIGVSATSSSSYGWSDVSSAWAL